MSVKSREPGLFETSYRKVHQRAKREALLAKEVIISVRRAALVAQIKRQQGGK